MRTRFIIRGAAGRKGVFMIPIQWKQNDKKTMHVNEAENGVVYGMDPTHFDPNRTCTRAQIVTILWNALAK